MKHFATLSPMWNFTCQKSSFDKSPIFFTSSTTLLQKRFLYVKLQYLVSTYLQLDCLYLKKQIYSETFCHPTPHVKLQSILTKVQFLGGLSLHLNHLIASRTANYDWPFGTLPFRLFGSNLDTKDLETYPRTYSGHFWNMSIFDNSRAVWVLFRKWVVSENQSFLNEGAIVTPLSV